MIDILELGIWDFLLARGLDFGVLLVFFLVFFWILGLVESRVNWLNQLQKTNRLCFAKFRLPYSPKIRRQWHEHWCGISVISVIAYGYGSIPVNTIFNGMNIHLPAILMFTRGTRFWHTAICFGTRFFEAGWNLALQFGRNWLYGATAASSLPQIQRYVGIGKAQQLQLRQGISPLVSPWNALSYMAIFITNVGWWNMVKAHKLFWLYHLLNMYP